MSLGHRTRIKMNTFNLENQEQVEALNTQLGEESNYFKPISDIAYKFKLESSEIKKVEKEFDGESVTKYVLNISARSEEGEKYTGEWEVGASILRPVMKGFADGVKEFTLIRTGTGQKTRYQVTPVKDF